jgi:tripartite-type tricarboxylate transporter receptor subunit TctC
VATVREQGHPDLTFEGTVGLYGTRDISAEIKRRIAADITAVVADPAFRARTESVGTAPRTGTPEEFAAAIEEQRAKIAVIHEATAKR